MKTTSMKVLTIGLIVFLFSLVLGLYYVYYQFDIMVIKKTWGWEDARATATGFLFAQVFSVIGVLIAVIGMLMILQHQKQVESKPSQ